VLAETQTELSANLKGKEQLKKRLIAAYQRQVKNQKLQAEFLINFFPHSVITNCLFLSLPTGKATKSP